MHVYSCAECKHRFESDNFASRCPVCRCKVLIHLEGERRKAKNCNCGGTHACGSGCSCGH